MPEAPLAGMLLAIGHACPMLGCSVDSEMACTQVDTERRYAAALHQAVKRLMDPLAPELNALLAPAPPQGVPDPLAPVRTPRQLRPGSTACPPAEPAEDSAARCGPLKAALRGHLGALHPQLDARVLRRAAREAWNCVGAVRPCLSCAGSCVRCWCVVCPQRRACMCKTLLKRVREKPGCMLCGALRLMVKASQRGAQHLHEVLDESGEGKNEDMRSLDQLAPRLQLADAILVVPAPLTLLPDRTGCRACRITPAHAACHE